MFDNDVMLLILSSSIRHVDMRLYSFFVLQLFNYISDEKNACSTEEKKSFTNWWRNGHCRIARCRVDSLEKTGDTSGYFRRFELAEAELYSTEETNEFSKSFDTYASVRFRISKKCFFDTFKNMVWNRTIKALIENRTNV